MARTQVTSVARLNFAARQAQRAMLQEFASKNPGIVAARIANNPVLLNGYEDADVILETLMNSGMAKQLNTILESDQANRYVKRLIAELLMFHGL